MKRPSAKETEEDIIRLQEEFLASKQKSERDSTKLTVKQDFKNEADEDMEMLMEREDRHITTLLSKIVVHDVAESTFTAPQKWVKTQTGLPLALHMGDERPSDTGAPPPGTKKRPSLFAQHMARVKLADMGVVQLKKDTETMEVVDDKAPVESVDSPHRNVGIPVGLLPTDHTLVTGVGLGSYSSAQEARAIHEENMARLAALSSDEILKEQERIRQTLDPTLLAFIARRSKGEAGVPTQTDKSPPSKKKKKGADRERMDVETEKSDDEIPLRPNPNIPHFDKLEKDKLEWMKAVKEPDSQAHEGKQPARFDFEGNVIPLGEDIPTYMGLHHHGDEPERAGYTVNDLFTLARSAFPQQRGIALRCLAACLRESREGRHVGQLAPQHSSLLAPLLPAGLAFLLRWTLDDAVSVLGGGSEGSGGQQLVVAMEAMRSMLVSQDDEKELDRFFHLCGPLGLHSPSLMPAQMDKKSDNVLPDLTSGPAADEDSEQASESDADVFASDVVGGLVKRTSLLTRLSWIVNLGKALPAECVPGVVDVLLRVARHSRECAYMISQEKNLLSALVKNFLPQSWIPLDAKSTVTDKDIYNRPLPLLLKLLRVLCQSSCSLSLSLNSEYDLFNRCLAYLSLSCRGLGLPAPLAVDLQLESLRFCTVLVTYEMKLPSFVDDLNTYVTFYHSCLTQWRTEGTNASSEAVLTAWVTLFTNLLDVLIKRREIDDAILGLLGCVKELSNDLLKQFNHKYHLQSYSVDLTAACLEFTTTFIRAEWHQKTTTPAKVLASLESDWLKHWQPFFGSLGFQYIVQRCRSDSVLLLSDRSSEYEAVYLGAPNLLDPVIMVTLQSVRKMEDPDDVLCERVPRGETALGLLVAGVRLVDTLAGLHRGELARSVVKALLLQSDVVSWLRRVASSCCLPAWSGWNEAQPQPAPWIALFELDLVGRLLVLSGHIREDSSSPSVDFELIHRAALRIAPCLLPGQGHLSRQLLTRVIFSPQHVCPASTAAVQAIASDLSEAATLKDHYESTNSSAGLLDNVRDNLSGIGATYLTALSGALGSEERADEGTSPRQTWALVGSGLQDRLVPTDWSFLPVVYYHQISLVNKGASPPPNAILHCLRWVYFLEFWRCSPTDRTISMTTRLSRLFCAFLCSTDQFLYTEERRYLGALLRLLSRPTALARLTLEEHIPGLTGFYDMFAAAIEHFVGVAYCDEVFSGYILLPCHQRHHVKYRRAVWGEHNRAVRAITLRLQELSTSIQAFLEPAERSSEMIKLYLENLLSKNVTPARNPVPYLIAVHHVNQFIFDQSLTSDKELELQRNTYRSLIGSARNLGDLRHHLIMYMCPDLSSELGMKFYETLPPIRSSLIGDVIL